MFVLSIKIIVKKNYRKNKYINSIYKIKKLLKKCSKDKKAKPATNMQIIYFIDIYKIS